MLFIRINHSFYKTNKWFNMNHIPDFKKDKPKANIPDRDIGEYLYVGWLIDNLFNQKDSIVFNTMESLYDAD